MNFKQFLRCIRKICENSGYDLVMFSPDPQDETKINLEFKLKQLGKPIIKDHPICRICSSNLKLSQVGHYFATHTIDWQYYCPNCGCLYRFETSDKEKKDGQG